MTPLRQRMLDAMVLRGMAQRTQEAYTEAIARLARHYRRSPDALSSQEVQAWLLHQLQDKHRARSSVNQYASACRFLYGVVLGLDGKDFEIPLGPAPQRLPEILSRDELARLFADLGPVLASGFDWIDAPVDLIVNGTSASLAGELPPISPRLIAPGHTVCYDMMYAKEPTAFNRWAASHGAARTLDGLGMLVEQAAEAFWLWRGVRPDSAPVLAELRRQLAAG